jgi:cation:H+ antiporter
VTARRREEYGLQWLVESWSLWVLLGSAFLIGWGAETAQTFMSRALALSILAWLQTAPEFALEATIAWNQQTDLMIANLTGSLRLLVGLGWPLIFFVYLLSTWVREKRFVKRIKLAREDSLTVIFLFIAIGYFFLVFGKRSLTIYDAVALTVIYTMYLVLAARLPVHEEEEEEELPWIGKKIVRLPKSGQIVATTAIFVFGGVALYFSAHPFISTLEKWSVSLGISTFLFVQWVAPFLSEFPEKVTAFNWARQRSKAPMAVMNMVNSNVNQWTMLAAMIPVVYSISRGVITPVVLDDFHSSELALTIAQSLLGGLLLLDLEFSVFDAAGIFLLWIVQFVEASLRDPITVVYVLWAGWVMAQLLYRFARARRLPKALAAFGTLRFGAAAH